ncbi:MAG: hypothetical protein K2N44_17615 [Lachnospiraceae bacterium]|nr:hypothetical protein [Lachnospiraceae bacterium]
MEDNKIYNSSVEQINGVAIGTIDNIADLGNAPVMLADLPANTEPNNAYGLVADTEYSSMITQEGEIRWYAFDISELTKVSMLIKAEENMDIDIFLFKLNINTMTIESTNLSAQNYGSEEYFSCVIGGGIYYFAILGATGSGSFVLDFFENANYVDCEINDSIETAQNIGSDTVFTGGEVIGIIDTMRDVDFYKINITNSLPLLAHIEFTAPQNHSIVWINTDTSPNRVLYKSGNCILAPGVHYFAIHDTQGDYYSGNGTYKVSISVITGNLTKDFQATSYKYYPEYPAILQWCPDRSTYYLNGIEVYIFQGFGKSHGSLDSPLHQRWGINFRRANNLIYNIIGVKNDYTSFAENKKYSRVFFIEVGSEQGRTVFGDGYSVRGTVMSDYNVTYAIIAVDAITGIAVDVIDPDPNPFDGVTPSM